ncbi:MAG: hypothetical protein AAEJ04_00985 [Planctomycetota bacterium]
MDKTFWIWIIIFVVVPLLKRIFEGKVGKANSPDKDSLARKKAVARKTYRDAKLRRQLERDAGKHPDDMEELADAWVQVGHSKPKGDKSTSRDVPQRLGGGWVAVGGAPAAPPAKSAPIFGDGIPVASGGAGPLQIFTTDPPLPPKNKSEEPPEIDDSPYQLETNPTELRTAQQEQHDEAYQISDKEIYTYKAGTTTRSRNKKRSKWSLTRNQLQERLIWAEILGSPTSLKSKEN